MPTEEFVLASEYDNLADAYERLKAQYEAELHHSFHRKPPRTKQPRVVIRERKAPLDIPAEQTPS